MKINKKLFFLLILIFFITFIYNFLLFEFGVDEVWNYGFSYNISKGLVPYRDFNMIVTPLFSFFGAIFIKIFGNYLLSLHIFGAICIVIMFCLVYKSVKSKAFIIFPLILLFSYPSYNILSVLFYFLIIYVYDNEFGNKYLILGFLASCMFLTKQTVGFMVFLPIIYYSKEKIKTLIGFLVPCIIFLLYLLYFNCFYQFFDYCFLGMFDFTGENGDYFSYFLLFEIIIILFCIYNIIKSRFNDFELVLVLMFQIMAFPLLDRQHFIFSVIPVVYYIIRNYKISFKISLCFFFLFFLLIFRTLLFAFDKNYYIDNSSTFLKGRGVYYGRDFFNIYNNVGVYAKKAENDGKRVYLFTQYAYFIKLISNKIPDKYDLINKGNMGYKGNIKLVKEVDNYCNKNECIFILGVNDNKYFLQMDYYVINHFRKKFHRIDKISIFDVYSN